LPQSAALGLAEETMLSIRKAKKGDAKAAWKIRNVAILNQCVGHYSRDALKIWTSGELSEAFANAVEKYFYVAVYNKQVIGTGMIDTQTGKLDAIFVHPSHIRKGVGRKIVSFLESIAVNHGLETLNLESTLNAASFYRACGFKGNEVGTYNSPRGVSLDCIPMIKVISPNKAINSDA
jgi:N-acetylglutamate synthase-like GNAT family acetyltransferase